MAGPGQTRVAAGDVTGDDAWWNAAATAGWERWLGGTPAEVATPGADGHDLESLLILANTPALRSTLDRAAVETLLAQEEERGGAAGGLDHVASAPDQPDTVAPDGPAGETQQGGDSEHPHNCRCAECYQRHMHMLRETEMSGGGSAHPEDKSEVPRSPKHHSAGEGNGGGRQVKKDESALTRWWARVFGRKARSVGSQQAGDDAEGDGHADEAAMPAENAEEASEAEEEGIAEAICTDSEAFGNSGKTQNRLLKPVCDLNPKSYTLHPTPYTLHPTPYTLHPTPYTTP